MTSQAIENGEAKSMKGVHSISMEATAAKAAYEEYKTALAESRGGGFIREYYQLKLLYKHLSKGKKIIDLRDTIKAGGLNKFGQPRLAVACIRHGSKVARCDYNENGSVTFSVEPNARSSWEQKDYVSLPTATLPVWKREQPLNDYEKTFRTMIPVVPPKYLPDVKDLQNYFILWEVKNWKSLPRDPILLRKISEFAFVVLAAWDLTDAERVILR
jgi:hypothetical protein